MIREQDIIDLNVSFYEEIIALFDSDPYCCQIPLLWLSLLAIIHGQESYGTQHQDLQAKTNPVRDGGYEHFIYFAWTIMLHEHLNLIPWGN